MRYSASAMKIELVLLLFLCIATCGPQKQGKTDSSSRSDVSSESTGTAKAGTPSTAMDQRPEKSRIVNPKFPVEKIFGAWTTDPDGPHADFQMSPEHYFVVDYEGDGEMPYIVSGDSIAVFFPDFTARGSILRALDDTLEINWENQGPSTYVRWKG